MRDTDERYTNQQNKAEICAGRHSERERMKPKVTEKERVGRLKDRQTDRQTDRYRKRERKDRQTD
jgi:hypothetical protein